MSSKQSLGVYKDPYFLLLNDAMIQSLYKQDDPPILPRIGKIPATPRHIEVENCGQDTLESSVYPTLNDSTPWISG
jgi:hypothetical protein